MEAQDALVAIEAQLRDKWPLLIGYAPKVFDFFKNRLAKRLDAAPAATVAEFAKSSGIAAGYAASAINGLIAAGKLTEEAAVRRMQEPDFLLTIAALLSDAGEKQEIFWLSQIEALTSELLLSESQSRKALVLKTASAAISGLNSRQLKILALMYKLQFGRLTEMELLQRTAEEFSITVEETFDSFEETAADSIDLRIFESLNLVSFLQHSRAESRLLQQISGVAQVINQGTSFELPHSARKIFSLWQGDMMNARIGFDQAELTATGYVLGSIVASTLTGSTSSLADEWDEPLPIL